MNEETRVVHMLEDAVQVLENEYQQKGEKLTEIIIVDDGSTDGTVSVVTQFAKDHYSKHVSSKVRFYILSLRENYGKGFAIRQAVPYCKGEIIMFADGDGATAFKDVMTLEANLPFDETTGYGVVVGSRDHLIGEGVTRKRRLYRNILMYIFHFVVKYIGGAKEVRDTQCGFKMFTRRSAQIIFGNMRIDRWCFDIEMLRIASQLNMPIKEVAVHWNEVGGSKLTMIGMVKTGIDVFVIRLMHGLGIWKINNKLHV